MSQKIKPGHVLVEVVEGVEGPSLSIGDNDTGERVAGPKPWGGGRTSHCFQVAAKDLIRLAKEYASAEPSAPKFGPDTVVCRRYELNGRTFYHYDEKTVYNSVPVKLGELLRIASPVERDERALPAWLSVDAERVTVRLSRPSEANGVQVDSLALRAPTVRDIRNAQLGGAKDDEQRELNLFASLAEVSVNDLEGMSLKDYSRLQSGYFHLVQDNYRAALERKS